MQTPRLITVIDVYKRQVVTCINNVGPGLNQVGPAANFGALHPLSKIVLKMCIRDSRIAAYALVPKKNLYKISADSLYGIADLKTGKIIVP